MNVRLLPRAFVPAQRLGRWHRAIGPLFLQVACHTASRMHQAEDIASENPAQKQLHLNRREDLQTVDATVAFATAANDLTGAASAANTAINTSERNAGGFGPRRVRPALRRRRASTAHGDERACRISGPAGRRSRPRSDISKSKGDVWFPQMDEIARLVNRAGPPAIDRSPPSLTGLPRPTV